MAVGSLVGGAGKKATDTELPKGDLSEMAAWLQPFGQKSMAAGQEGLESAMQFFKRLTSGDQGDITRAVAPGVNTIVSQYDAARKAISEFGARGGGRNEMLAELPFRQAGDIAKLVQGAQLEGAKQLPQVASLLSQQGLGAAGLTAQNLRAMLEQEMEKRKQNTELGVGIGQIAAMLLKNYLPGGKTSGGG
jgi:Trp operon repressor